MPLSAWLLAPFTSSGPLTFVPTCGETGAMIGPATAMPSSLNAWAFDCAFLLSRNVQAWLALACQTPPVLPLPLSRWSLKTLAFSGPLTLVPAWGSTGTTIGPATDPAPAPSAAASEFAFDCAPMSSTQVQAPSQLSWWTPPRLPLPLPLPAWPLATLTSAGPLAFVPSWPETGATIGPDTAAAPAPATMRAPAPAVASDCAPSLFRPVSCWVTLACQTSPSLPFPLSIWPLTRLALTGPLRLVPTCGVTGATIGPDTARAPAPASWPAATANALELDCAPRLSTPVQSDCQLSWPTLPNSGPLPLACSLLPASTLTGPAALVPTCGAIGATTGPDTATAPAAESKRLPANAKANELDSAPSLSSHVNDWFPLSCSTGPRLAFSLSCALLRTLPFSGPVTLVPTCGLTGSTNGPANAPAIEPPSSSARRAVAAAALDCAPRLSTPVHDEFQLSWRMSLPLPLWSWLLKPFTSTGPLRFVPTCGVIGATMGPDAAAASEPAAVRVVRSPDAANALDWAPSLSSQVKAWLPLSWSTAPAGALPLSCWLLSRLPLAGPTPFVPTWGAIGATIGPDTATAPASPPAITP